MIVLSIGVQVSEDENEIVVWALDVQTKLALKLHLPNNNSKNFTVGKLTEIIFSENHIKRQELWVTDSLMLEEEINISLTDILDMKASTPHSLINCGYTGNICKIEAVYAVAGDEMEVSFIGFPKEKKYIRIHDAKWKRYYSMNEMNEDESEKVIQFLNSRNDKYVVIDFPGLNGMGLIDVGALVVI